MPSATASTNSSLAFRIADFDTLADGLDYAARGDTGCNFFSACGELETALTYRGGIDNPATIKATWISYLNGDDIRAACTEGAPLSYRLVYNSDYDVQLRSYEVTGDGAGGATLTARVQGPSGLVVNEAIFSDSLGFARWTKRERRLDAAQREALDAALEASGAFAPAPQGLQLFSKETYWITSLCRDGTFHFNAWRYPSDRFDAITFDEMLFGFDETGVAVRVPVAVPSTAAAEANVPRRREGGDERGNYFLVKVGENGFTDRLASRHQGESPLWVQNLAPPGS